MSFRWHSEAFDWLSDVKNLVLSNGCKILIISDVVHVGGSKAHCLQQYFSCK